MDEITRPSYMEVDLNNFNYNIQQIKNGGKRKNVVT